MIVILIILIYIVTIFLGRYFDIKVCIHIHQIHYKTYIIYWMWFVPILNLFIPFLYFIDHEISTRKRDIKHNKFINWFFVGVNYKTSQEIKDINEFNKSFNDNKDTRHDLSNPFKRPYNNLFK